MKILSPVLLCIIAGMTLASAAHAGIVIGGTRVIYDATAKDASISVNNPDAIPYLVQTWIDNNSGNTQTAPFIVTPPLYRLNGGQQSTMRIVYSGATLPDNQESLFFINIKAIPSTTKKANVLQVAVKSRMKLIYRPASLRNSEPEKFAEKLSWSVSSGKLNVTNPTPYYMNFGEVSVNKVKVNSATWVAPNSSASFPVPGTLSAGRVEFKLINDYGGLTELFHSN